MIEELMGIEIQSFKGGWSMAARPCDGCNSAGAAVFCRADSVFLCIPCDTRIHRLLASPDMAVRHERVWVCEVCEQAPAVVVCKADAAALCVACDTDIHSANPLARRHERVPVEPFFDSAVDAAKCSVGVLDLPAPSAGENHVEDPGVCSWLIQNDFNQINQKINVESTDDIKSLDFISSDFDRFIDIEYDLNSVQNPNSAGNDGLVPVQAKPDPVQFLNTQEYSFDIGFCKSKLSSFGCPTTQSVSHSISSSSLEFGVVPDGGSSMSEFSLTMSQNVSHGSAVVDPSAAVSSGIDRKARVLRYREKRKNRKFEKTIRYASRKAYAESRPRVKGRFAKRTGVQNDGVGTGRMYVTNAHAGSGYIMGDVSRYGVVPTF